MPHLKAIKVSKKDADLFLKTLPAGLAIDINWDAHDGLRKKALKSKKYSQTKAADIIRHIQAQLNKGGVVNAPGGLKLEGTGDGGFIIAREGQEMQEVWDKAKLATLSGATAERMQFPGAPPPTPVSPAAAPEPPKVVKDKKTKDKKADKKTDRKRKTDARAATVGTYQGPVYIDDFFSDVDAGQFWAGIPGEVPTRALPSLTKKTRSDMKIDKRDPKRRIVAVPAKFPGSRKPQSDTEKDVVAEAIAEGEEAANIVDCNEVRYQDLLEGKTQWSQDASEWFTKWSRGFCGWMAGATVHPKSKRQQLDPAGAEHIEQPAELRKEIGECREMMFEMRDVLAPSACSYGVRRILSKKG